METKIRVRIAPSPTGFLHVGTARAALFNELFARKEGGSFIVRLEDTDPTRSKPEFEKDILEGLSWLGIKWDEGPDIGGEYGPYKQSERTELYSKALEQLLAEGKAYKGEGETIVLKVESQEVTFEDIVRGTVTVHTDSFENDFIIARSMDKPLFHLAVVVDDATMEISHVIRGEDHLHNTIKHILIQRALGYSTPVYAHLPLLLDEKRAKLSKRTNETSLLKYKELGYLPEAMVNYLAFLGWNPKTEEEFFTHEELRERFSLEGVQKAGAIFSQEKLDAVNAHYIRKLSPSDLLTRFIEYYESLPNDHAGKAAVPSYDFSDKAYWEKAIATEQTRAQTLQELIEALAIFQPDFDAVSNTENIQDIVWRKSTAEDSVKLLKQLIQKLESFSDSDFTMAHLEKTIIDWLDAETIGKGDMLYPMRFALSGRKASPGPFELAGVLGKEVTLKRLNDALLKLQNA